MNDIVTPEKNAWGWKGAIIAAVLSVLFLAIFYLAMSNEPGYMPSQQNKPTQQHAFKNAPSMSAEAMAEAQQQKLAREAAAYKVSENKATENQNAAPAESAHGH